MSAPRTDALVKANPQSSNRGFSNAVLMTVWSEVYAVDDRERDTADKYLGLYNVDASAAARAGSELMVRFCSASAL